MRRSALLMLAFLLCGCAAAPPAEMAIPAPTAAVSTPAAQAPAQQPAPTAALTPTPTAAPTEAPTQRPVPAEKTEAPMPTPQRPGGAYAPHEVIALMQSEQEARAVAAQYGLQLKSFQYGVAVFTCEEDAQAFLARVGNEPGTPAFSLNYEVSIAQPGGGVGIESIE